MTSAFIQVTDRCQLRCKYCFYSTGYLEYSKEATLISITDMINFLISMKIENVIITGGDPLHPSVIKETLELTKTLRAIGIDVSIDTALIVRGNEILSELIDLQLSMMYVSCDSHHPEVHNKQRGLWDKTIYSIKKLIDAGVPVYINCSVTSLNFSEIKETRKFFINMGVNDIDFHTAYIPKNAKHFKELSCENLSSIDKKKLCQNLLWCASGNEKKVAYCLFQIRWLFDSETYVPMKFSCKMGKDFIVIDRHGVVTPCFHLPCWGNTSEVSIIKKNKEIVEEKGFDCIESKCLSLFAIDSFCEGRNSCGENK